MKNLSRYFFKNKRDFLMTILGDVLLALSMVAWSFFMKNLAEAAEQTDFSAILRLACFGLAFLLFHFLSFHLMHFFRRRFLRAVNQQLRTDIFGAIVRKNISAFNSTNSARYISILNNDLAVIENDYFANVPGMLEQGILVIIASATLILFHPLIALIVIALSLIQLLVPKFLGDKLSKKNETLMQELEQYNAKIKDLFTGFEVIKSFRAEQETQALHAAVADEVEQARYAYRRLSAKAYANQSILVYLASILQLSFSAYLAVKGEITLGVLLGSMQMSNYVLNPVEQLSNAYLSYKSSRDIRGKVERLLAEKVDDRLQCTDCGTLEQATPVVLKDVFFSYNGADDVLKGINYTFEAGKKYAIVGASGSGKSTLLKLLMNYYNSYAGEINFGGQPLREIDEGRFYQTVATIHQSVILFDDSIKNNISMFQEYSDAAISDAAERAGLKEFIARQEYGMETRIRESGNNLSGGEKQRIAIARALLRNARVLLVDEATSNLDNELALQIEDLLLRQAELTAIIITHRMTQTQMRKFDAILALKDGRIEESGCFDALMEQRGYFYGLFLIGQ